MRGDYRGALLAGRRAAEKALRLGDLISLPSLLSHPASSQRSLVKKTSTGVARF